MNPLIVSVLMGFGDSEKNIENHQTLPLILTFHNINCKYFAGYDVLVIHVMHVYGHPQTVK